MNKTTLLALLGLVLALVVAVQLQQEREGGLQTQAGESLLGEVDAGSIRSISVDHVERKSNLELRNEDSAWRIEDPVNYPADPAFVNELLAALGQTAMYVAESEREPLAARFEPPRARIRVSGAGADGSTWDETIDLGPLDPDGERVLVRARGQVMRVKRSLDTILLRNTNEFRDSRVFTVHPTAVVRLLRRGFVVDTDRLRSMDMTAAISGGRWRLESPHRVGLSSEGMRLWATAMCGLRVGVFVNDDPRADMARWGLAVPDFQVTLEDNRGVLQTVLFGKNEQGGYYCKREEDHHVFQVDRDQLPRVTRAWLEFLDPLLWNAFRRDARHLDLAAGDQRVRLSQLAENDWVVSSADASGGWTELGPAEPTAIQDLFGQLEGARIGPYLVDDPEAAELLFAPGADERSVRVELGGFLEGQVHAFRFGPPVAPDGGEPMDTVLREGDELVGLVAPGIVPFLERPGHRWLDRHVWSIDESPENIDRLTLGADGRERVFSRTQQGTWQRPDGGQATELYEVLDPLLFLKAAEHLPGPARGRLLDPVSVAFHGAARDVTWSAAIGVGPEGRVLVEREGRHSVLADPTLHARLLGIVD